MAYTLPLTITLVCLSSIFLFLSKTFSQKSIKTLFVGLCLASTILISQSITIIAEQNAGSTNLTELKTIGTTATIITITLFSFFILYFMVIYLLEAFHRLRDVKKQKYRRGEDEM